MDPNPWPRRYKIVALISLALATVILGGRFVFFSQSIGSELFKNADVEIVYDIDVIGVGGGRITLARSAATERAGIWSIESENAQGQISEIVSSAEISIERIFRSVNGEFSGGDKIRVVSDVFFSDPEQAHNIDFETVRVVSNVGVLPAWFIEGDGATWVLYVHGRADAGRAEVLRMLPSLEDQRLPVLVISYRSDGTAPDAPGSAIGWGYDEWKDLAAAVAFARSEGAEKVILVGTDLGANIIMTYLHESADLSVVAGVVLETPLLNLQATVDEAAADYGIPGVLRPFAEAFVRVRYGVDWGDVNHMDRADQFDVPMLLMVGTADPLLTVAAAEDFAVAVPDDLVTVATFEAGSHATLWNVDPDAYDAAILGFIDRFLEN